MLFEQQRRFSSTCLYGWISTLKDTFGFIEDFEHNSEIFFHFSELQSPLDSYYPGLPVSYHTGMRGKHLVLLLLIVYLIFTSV